MNPLTTDIAVMKQHAAELRGRIIEVSGRAGVPHLGSCLSCVDILTTLYWGVLRHDPAQPISANRDRFLLSKGHAAPALFQVLAKRGFFPENLLDTYGEDGSVFAEHPPAHGVPGIEAATGSLGHGLPLAIGMMLGMQLTQQPGRVFTLLGDGECNEGSVWEAAMMAAAQRLDRLTVIIDYNKWQATDRSNEVLSLGPLSDKWSAFGWSVTEVDGHEIGELHAAFTRLPLQSGKPSAIIAHTIKGKGVSFMEDDNNWHYRIPNPNEVQRARNELGLD